MQGDNTLFQQLNNIIAFSLKDDHLKLLELHEKFKNFKVVNPYDRPDLAYKHAFGFFVSEYLRDLKVLDEKSDIDSIFLQGRRLLECVITVKYIQKHDLFEQVVGFCEWDRKEYLEGQKARVKADLDLFPYLEGVIKWDIKQQQDLDYLRQKYAKPCKLPPVRKMADDLGLEADYAYFYKLTSKILHFCPFSLNNEHLYDGIVHKRVFLLRIDRYFKELIKELSNLFQFLSQIGS